MSKKELKLEGRLDLPVVIDYIEKIVQGLKDGKVFIKKRTETLALEPKSPVEFTVEVKQKKDEDKLELKLKWQRNFIVDESLKISAK
jgi:amphi-Trp domain-containing protein